MVEADYMLRGTTNVIDQNGPSSLSFFRIKLQVKQKISFCQIDYRVLGFT